MKNDPTELQRQILRLAKRSGKTIKTDESQPFPFSSALEDFVHLSFSDDEAARHWSRIIEIDREIKEKLGRETSIYLSIVDYFTHKNNLLTSPLLVELYLFEETKKMVMMDPLTGAFNRRYMDIFLRKEFYRCGRYNKELSVCLIDIDDFKAHNDSRGHLFGDEILKNIVMMFQESMREEDVLCRFGGEEFLLILPETDSAGARTLVERLHKKISASTFFTANHVSFSGGVASFPKDAQDLDTLIQTADNCLYKAKSGGKNRIVTAESERREAFRYCGKWAVTIRPENGDEPVSEAWAKNISMDGMNFECRTVYPVDSAVLMRFSERQDVPPGGESDAGGAPPNAREVEAAGRIIWSKKERDGYSYGVKFSESPGILQEKFPARHDTDAGADDGDS